MSRGQPGRVGLLCGLDASAAVCHEHSSEGRPSGLMRGAETLSGVAVKVFIEEERVAPCRVLLETGVHAMCRAPAIGVEHKQAQQAAPEFIGDLIQISLPARSVGSSTVRVSPKKL